MKAENGRVFLSPRETKVLYYANVKRKNTAFIASTFKMNVLDVEAILEGMQIIGYGSRVCQYADSCFNCPLSDCAIAESDAPLTNAIILI